MFQVNEFDKTMFGILILTLAIGIIIGCMIGGLIAFYFLKKRYVARMKEKYNLKLSQIEQEYEQKIEKIKAYQDETIEIETIRQNK